jgi:hypothetical protein
MSEAATGAQRGIKRMRIIRAVAALAVALNAFIFAVDLSTGSPLVLLPPACIVALLVLIVMQTRLIRSYSRTQELNRHADRLELAAKMVREGTLAGMTTAGSDLTLAAAGSITTADLELGCARLSAALGPCAHPGAEPVDLLLTGERVAWICPDCNAELPAGWTAMESPHAACDCGECGDAAREFAEQLREQIIASQGIPPAKAPERLTDSEVKDATEAAVHFAQLARVGRESCASPCRLCEARDQLYPTPESRVLLAAKLAAFKDDESLRQWIEAEQQGGTRSRAPMTGPGGRWRPVSELPEVQQATEGIPAGPLIENMRQELEAQREVTSPEPPAGSYDFHFDSAGREWCRDTGMRCWIKPTPDGPWYRQNKSGGGER